MLVERYDRAVYTLCLRTMHDPEEARDCTQEAFFKAFRSLRTFKPEAKFSTWIFSIAYHACCDRLGRRKRLTNDELPDEPIPAPGPAAVAERNDEARALRAAIAALPEKYRTVITLYHLQKPAVRGDRAGSRSADRNGKDALVPRKRTPAQGFGERMNDDFDELDRALFALPLETPPPGLRAAILLSTIGAQRRACAHLAPFATWEILALGTAIAVAVWLAAVVRSGTNASAAAFTADAVACFRAPSAIRRCLFGLPPEAPSPHGFRLAGSLPLARGRS